MLGRAFGALRTLTSVVPLVRWPAFGDLGEAKAQGVRVSNGERGAVMLMELIGKRKVKMVKSSLKSSLKSMFHLCFTWPTACRKATRAVNLTPWPAKKLTWTGCGCKESFGHRFEGLRARCRSRSRRVFCPQEAEGVLLLDSSTQRPLRCLTGGLTPAVRHGGELMATVSKATRC